jgi:tetratricopeptide (TPR) repeat protein
MLHPASARTRLHQDYADRLPSLQSVPRLHHSPRASCRSATTLILLIVERCLTGYASDALRQRLVLRWWASAGWGKSSGGNLRLALASNIRCRKSQLAIEHCYRTAEQSPETWVFWAHASNPARLEQSFWEIAHQVKVRGRKDAQADVFKLVRDWLRNEKNGRWLLVLDNADDAGVLSPPPSNSHTSPTGASTSTSGLQRHLSEYVPPSRHGSVLVTSRTRRAALQIVEDSDVVLIEPMHDADARALLYKKLGDKVDRSDGIAELAAALEYMPLALVQAAAYIRERTPRSSVRQYLAEYCESDSRKTSLLNQAAGHLRRDKAASNSVLLTWQISFDHVRSRRKSATDLLSLMSFFDRQGIQEALLRDPSGTTDDDNFEDNILILRDYSFITVAKEANTFEMHNLVQLATRTWLENQGQLNRWRERFISNICADMPTGQYENWQKCQVLFPHARAALAQQPQGKDSLKKWALLLYKAAWYAIERGQVGEAEHMSTVSMKVRQEVFGKENAETLSSMHMVGIAKRLGAKYKEAEVINRETLALYQTVLGREHHSTLTSMSTLAGVLESQGKYEEAEVMNRQTLALKEIVLGHEHPDTLTSISNLAGVLESQGKYEEAEAMNRQTLVLRETVLGREHPGTLASMSNLAGVLESQGKYEEAEAMNRQTLVLRETVLGRKHPWTLASMSNLAGVLESQGKYKEAEAMNRQTLVLRETALGRKHPDTLISMSDLALVLSCQGKYEEAEAMNRQTLVLRETVLGREHPDTLASISNLAGVLQSQGKYKEAEVMNRQVLALKERVLGRKHLDTLTSMSNLALVLSCQGKYEEAEAMNRQTLVLKETVLGHKHLGTLISMSNLATVLESQAKYKEAEAMIRQTLVLKEIVLRHGHPSTLTSMSNLAAVLEKQGKDEEAEVINRQTLALKEIVLRHGHPSTLTSMSNLAVVLGRQGKYREAESMIRQALALKETELGHEHPSTLASVYCLAHILAEMRCYHESLALYERACAGYHIVFGEDHPTTRECRHIYATARMHATKNQC